jgi:hypothetical protein
MSGMNSHEFALSHLFAFAILLVSSQAAWCQGFETSIHSRELTCNQLNQYDVTAKSDIEKSVGDTCTLDGNAANASSSASLDLALTAFAATQNAATESVAKAIQTATLKPTKGFTGTKLQFSFADRYATQLSGSGYVGKAVVCPFIAQLNFNLHQIFSSNGQGGGTLHQQLVLKKSSAGFKLTFAMEVGAVVGGGSGKAGAVTSSYPTSTLP